MEKSLKFFLLFITLFVFGCTSVSVSKRLELKITRYFGASDKLPPFKGKLKISFLSVPFKYDTEKDKLKVPLTYSGFVKYANRTLCLDKYCKTYPLELWKILTGKVVFSKHRVEKFGENYLVRSEKGKVITFLVLDKNLKPKEVEVCSDFGCEKFKYIPFGVETNFYGKKLLFIGNYTN
jgi:hypothetical protein